MLKEKTKELYETLLKEKKEGKKFTKKDLTYEILYQLAINENISDQSVGYIFGLTKNQVKYQRQKYNLENKFLKKCIDNPDIFIGFLEEQGFDIKEIGEEKLYGLINWALENKVEERGWNKETYKKYLKESNKLNIFKGLEFINNHLSEVKEDNTIFTDDEIYDIEYKSYTNYKHKESKQQKNKVRKSDQVKNSISKIKSGKLGEKIVANEEKKKLNKLGLTDLAKKVKIITNTEDENITLDGLGYDVESYNEKGEKIYIEVKTSLSANNDNIDFYITINEINFLNGKTEKADKEHAYIYYLYNINKEKRKAQILVINYKTFSKFKLNPVQYRITENGIND